jgi:type I restriction enzyme S subunit
MRTVTLGEVMDFQNGRAFKSTEWREVGLPIIRIQNLNNRNSSYNYFDGTFDERILIVEGDLLFSWSGTVGTSFGPHIWAGPRSLLNQHIFKVGLNPSIEKKYAFYALLSITTRIEDNVNGSVGLTHITKAKLINFEIPLPPLNKQQEIVKILDSAFSEIEYVGEKLNQSFEKSHELLQSLFNEAFHVPKNVSQSATGTAQSEVFAKNHLKLVRLKDLCNTISGLWTGKKAPFEKAIVIRNTNFTKDCKLDLSDVAVLDVESRQLQTRRLLPGDLIVEKSGGGPKQAVGRVVLFDETDGVFSLSNFTSALRINNPEVVLPQYLQHFLYFQYASGVTEAMQSHSTGIRNLNIHQFLDICVPLPSIEIQKNVIARLDSAFNEIKLMHRNIDLKREQSYELRQSILSSLFSYESKAA